MKAGGTGDVGNERMLIGCLPRENSTLDHGLGSGRELGSWGDHTCIPVGFVEQDGGVKS